MFCLSKSRHNDINWVDRAAVFFQLVATLMLSTLVGVPATWYLMKSSSLLAMEVSIGFVCAGSLLVFFLPETLEEAKLLEASSHALAGDGPPEEGSSKPLKMPSILDVIKESNFVVGSPALRTLGTTFVVGPLLAYSTEQLVLLASDRYHWSMADVRSLSCSLVANLIYVIGQFCHIFERNSHLCRASRPSPAHILGSWIQTGPASHDQRSDRSTLEFDLPRVRLFSNCNGAITWIPHRRYAPSTLFPFRPVVPSPDKLP
jgi:hypothetical protein